MRVVKRLVYAGYEFDCKHCGSTLTALGSEFGFVRPGVLEYDCPVCKKKKHIRLKLLRQVKEYSFGKKEES